MSVDLLTRFWENKRYRLVDADVALAELRAVIEKDERLADGFDLSDPAKPVAVRPCRKCQTELRFPLYLDDGTIMVSAYTLGLLRFAICEACAEAEERARDERVHADVVVKRLSESGLSPALAEKVQSVGWDGLIVQGVDADETALRERAIGEARLWAQGERERGVWLHGPAGSGKTHLLALAAVTRMRREPVRWVSVAALVAHLQAAWSDAERAKALRVLTEPGLVVLDDLTQVVPTDRVRSQLFTALDSRDQARVSVCVSSNEPPSKVSEMYGSPMMSRLVSLATPLLFPGADQRVAMALQA